MKIKTIFSILSLFTILILSHEVIQACSCARVNPPCNGIDDKESAIFLGQVLEITNDSEEKKVLFKVIEPFKNARTQNLIIYTAVHEVSCGFNFKKDEKYLVYSNTFEGKLYTSLCSRTRSFSEAQDDLQILRQVDSGKAILSRIFGNIRLIKDEKSYEENSLVGIEVRAFNENGKSYETSTDNFGSYRLIDLPFGKYKLQANYKDGFTKTAEIILESKKGQQCVENDFFFKHGGIITGKVVDNEGNPVAGIRVTLESASVANSKERPFWIHNDENGNYEVEEWGYTDKNGNYEIEGLKSGKYILGVNHIDPINKEFPFLPTTVHKGTNSDRLIPFEIISEMSLNEIDFKLSPKVKTKLITGFVFLSNGKPATHARVRLKEERTNRDIDSIDVNKDGQFFLYIFEGQSYQLTVYKDSDSYWGLKESEKTLIPATGKIEPLRFIVPPPSKK